MLIPEVGKTQKLSDGSTVTLTDVMYAIPTKPNETLPVGKTQMGINVKVCAQSQIKVSGFMFSVTLNDSTKAPYNLGEIDPQFLGSNMLPGDCNAGWVTFAYTAKLKPVTVHFSIDLNGQQQTVRWQL